MSTAGEFYIQGVDSLGKPTALVVLTDQSGSGVSLTSKMAHERRVGQATEYGVGVPEAEYAIFDEADEELTISSDLPALLFGIFVNELPDQPLEVRDGIDNTGTLVYTLPVALLTLGAHLTFPGTKFNTGLFLDIATAATVGNFTVEWRLQ